MMIREPWDEETEHSRYILAVWLLQWGRIILQGGRYEDLRAYSKDSLLNFFGDMR